MPPLPLRPLTPNDGAHWFFGYYDVEAFGADDTTHLCHRVAFRDRLPGSEDEAQLGVIDLATGAWRPFATTRAWNFQQGAMLQWLGGAVDTVAYNLVGRDGVPRGAVRALGEKREHPHERPFAALSRDGRWALSVSFARMFDFRPGYGYAGQPDSRALVAQPEDDGLWLMNLSTGVTRLVLSLAALGAIRRAAAPTLPAGEKLLVNHVTFNPCGTRFVALVRNFPRAGEKWSTTVITSARDGGDVHVLVAAGYASHYWWRDDTTLFFHCDGPLGAQHYEIADAPASVFRAIAPEFFPADGHMRLARDGRTLIYDSYPDRDGRQHLWTYDLATKTGEKLGAYASLPVANWDTRCDLHPRWNRAGDAFSLDSTHEGRRALYLGRPEIRAVPARAVARSA